MKIILPKDKKVEGKKNVADQFTKSVPEEQFEQVRKIMKHELTPQMLLQLTS